MFRIYEDITNTVVNSLLVALKAVQPYYIYQNYGRIRVGHQRPERVFTAELYHQLRNLQENDGLHFSVEVIKQRYNINENHCVKLDAFQRISPDIILHKNQNDNSSKNQKLVCEIKMEGASYKKIIKDFHKLLYYKISPLQFNTAVFIFTGNIKIVEDILIKNKDLAECIKKYKIIFICLENHIGENVLNWQSYYII